MYCQNSKTLVVTDEPGTMFAGRLTEQRGYRLHVAVVDVVVLGRTDRLPQCLGVVDDLEVATGGQGPPGRPGQQGATPVALQEVTEEQPQHTSKAATAVARFL